MGIFLCITAKKCREKSSLGIGGKNGEKPKIQITESVKIGIHSTVFSVGESPNLKPKVKYIVCEERQNQSVVFRTDMFPFQIALCKYDDCLYLRNNGKSWMNENGVKITLH